MELGILLPYLENISSITKKRLNRCISKRLKFCKFKIIFQTGNRLKNYFRFKDSVLETYNLTLSRKSSAEAAQLPITVKPTDIRRFDHMLNCDHIVAWEDFSIIGRESNHLLLETKESLFIKRDNLSLNRNKYSQELFLF